MLSQEGKYPYQNITINCFQITMCHAVGDLHRQLLDEYPLTASFFHFHAVFRKIWMNNRLEHPCRVGVPLWEILEPLLPWVAWLVVDGTVVVSRSNIHSHATLPPGRGPTYDFANFFQNLRKNCWFISSIGAQRRLRNLGNAPAVVSSIFHRFSQVVAGGLRGRIRSDGGRSGQQHYRDVLQGYSCDWYFAVRIGR